MYHEETYSKKELIMFGNGLKLFVFIFLSITFFVKPISANDVFTAQRLLTELGYSPGPIDGAYGGKTKKAFVKLYTDQNMTFDGVVNKNELDLLKKLIAKINRPMPKLPVGRNAKAAGKKKALPLLKSLITQEVYAVELSDYDLCTSLMYVDLIDTYTEMKKRNLDCLYISEKQNGWKPIERKKAFKYLQQYQNRYKIKIPNFDLSTKVKPFGSIAETAEIYEILNPNFRQKILFEESIERKNFCYDWFGKVSYIAENQSKNIDGSQSWLEDSLRDGFVICQDTFNSSYLSALVSKEDLNGIKNIFENWINNDVPRRDIETKKNMFMYVLLINKSFAALEMLEDEFDWSDKFKLKLNKWIQLRALELFPTDLAGKHVSTYCKHKITNYSHMNEACKNGGILRAQALLRAGIMTNDKEFIEMAYIAFHRFMSGIRKDGSVAGDSVRGCTAADYNIWATQFMSDFHELWIQIGNPLWDFRVKNYASVRETIEYSLDLYEDFEKINKYTWDESWDSCGELKENKVQMATARYGRNYYTFESFGRYFFTFKPNVANKFFKIKGDTRDIARYTAQSGSNYEVSYLFTNPELIRDIKREEKLQKERFQKSLKDFVLGSQSGSYLFKDFGENVTIIQNDLELKNDKNEYLFYNGDLVYKSTKEMFSTTGVDIKVENDPRDLKKIHNIKIGFIIEDGSFPGFSDPFKIAQNACGIYEDMADDSLIVPIKTFQIDEVELFNCQISTLQKILNKNDFMKLRGRLESAVNLVQSLEIIN